jgi:hypothetical protein
MHCTHTELEMNQILSESTQEQVDGNNDFLSRIHISQ